MEVREGSYDLLYTPARYIHRQNESFLWRCGVRSQYAAVELRHCGQDQKVWQGHEQGSNT